MNTWFERFARKNSISLKVLREEIKRVEKGLIDADLGGNVIKQRIAKPGQGRSKGYRTIILFYQGGKAFFVYGFSKNEKENISTFEEKEFKNMAIHILALSETQLEELMQRGTFKEITDEKSTISN